MPDCFACQLPCAERRLTPLSFRCHEKAQRFSLLCRGTGSGQKHREQMRATSMLLPNPCDMGERKINHGGLFSRGKRRRQIGSDGARLTSRQAQDIWGRKGTALIGWRFRHCDGGRTSISCVYCGSAGSRWKLASRYHASPVRRWGWGGASHRMSWEVSNCCSSYHMVSCRISQRQVIWIFDFVPRGRSHSLFHGWLISTAFPLKSSRARLIIGLS